MLIVRTVFVATENRWISFWWYALWTEFRDFFFKIKPGTRRWGPVYSSTATKRNTNTKRILFLTLLCSAVAHFSVRFRKRIIPTFALIPLKSAFPKRDRARHSTRPQGSVTLFRPFDGSIRTTTCSTGRARLAPKSRVPLPIYGKFHRPPMERVKGKNGPWLLSVITVEPE